MTTDRDRRRHRLEARAAVIAKYGSAEAALAPCPRERLILAAVAPWRTTLPDGWTDALDGWRGGSSAGPSSRVLAAIRLAYPMPTTFREALAGCDYWRERRQEIALALDEKGSGSDDGRLDLAASVRADEVLTLVERVLPATTIREVRQRFHLFRRYGYADTAIAEALFRDIEALARREREPALAANGSTPTINLAGSISAALDADPSRSDRDVARTCRCSPTTVGKVRRGMGLGQGARTVRRGAQTYELRLG